MASSACTTRRVLCPPSLVRCSDPFRLRVKLAPNSASSRTWAGPSLQTTSTALHEQVAVRCLQHRQQALTGNKGSLIAEAFPHDRGCKCLLGNPNRRQGVCTSKKAFVPWSYACEELTLLHLESLQLPECHEYDPQLYQALPGLQILHLVHI